MLIGHGPILPPASGVAGRGPSDGARATAVVRKGGPRPKKGG
ncbi:hypothetical protein BN2537_4835 [Streptomyces venezuelae]|nr:hypothetical protein BN2537_4835 [Streptomyces venezuelae]